MPYYSDKERCRSHIFGLESRIRSIERVLVASKREALKIPKLKKEIEEWKKRIKEKRDKGGFRVKGNPILTQIKQK